MLTQIRAISYNLLPNTLVHYGLKKAIEELTEKFDTHTPIKISIEYTDDWQLAPDQELNVYRICKEIVHNAIRHSQAQNLILKFFRVNDVIYFTGEDDGIGFDYDENGIGTDGLGLNSLKSRADLLNAKISIFSETTKGTRYQFEIPLT